MIAPPPIMPRPDRAKARRTLEACAWFASRLRLIVAGLRDIASREEVLRG